MEKYKNMEQYKNMVLLVDNDDYRTDAIIFTNEDIETIEKAIDKAKELWDGSCYLLQFIEKYLKDNFDILFFADYWRVYY